MGINLSKITHSYYTGTTSANANEAACIKNVLNDEMARGAYYVHPIFTGTGAAIYTENACGYRDGINFPTAVVEVDGDDPVSAKVIRLTDSKFVVFSNVDGAKLEGTVVDVSGTTPTCGTIATINDADTDSWDACPIGTAGTHFALIYRDNGGDDYVYGRIGSVSGTTITMGDEKALDSTDVGTENSGERYGVCEPRSGVLFFTWCDSDDDVAAVAAPYSGVTVGTLGSQNEISTGAGTQLACCPAGANKVFVAFSQGGDSNYLHGRVATVSAAGVIGTWGTEYDIFASDAAATYVEAHYVQTDKVIVTGEDASNDPFAIALTISTTTLTRGTKVTFLAGTVTDVGCSLIDSDQGIIKWDNGTNGECVRFSISSTTITADASTDPFVETTSAGCTTGGITCTTTGKAVIVYQDADSDLAIKVGQYHENKIIDIRSATASVDYVGIVLPEQEKIETEAKV